MIIIIIIMARAASTAASTGDREFTKGGLVKGGLAIRHVFNLHMKNGT